MPEMQIGYGAFRHPVGWANLANFRALVNHTPRSFKLTTTIESHVSGDIVLQPGEDEYDLDSYINQLQLAFRDDGYDWGLYHTDGSPTAHYLWSGDPTSLTGNQITYKSFPESHGGEYVTGRSFAYKVQNTFDTSETALIDYSETIQQKGDTGPIVRWVEADRFNPAYPLYLASTSSQETIQRGYAITMGTWFSAPAPILGRPYLIGQDSFAYRHHPRKHPQGYTEYKTEWIYKYITTTDLGAFPTLR